MTTISIAGPSAEDTSKYQELNETIKAGLATFLEVGSALAEIRDRRLYRVEFETWDDYLENKHGLKRQYASRLIKAREVVAELEALLPIGNKAKLPTNDSQVRPLFRLKSPDARSQAWIRAIEVAGEKQPTAEIVSMEVQAMLPEAKSADRERFRQQGDQETKSAFLQDGCEVPEALWVEGYVNSETAQRKLDEIGKALPQTEETVSLQRFFIGLVTALNGLHEQHPTSEMRNGVSRLFREILFNLPVIVSKPGDWEVPHLESN